MKKLLLVLCFIFSTVIIARNDIDLSSFNKQMIKNMDEVIEDNPEIYETKSLTREPASVKPAKETTTEKLDKFQEQVGAPKSW